MGGNTRAAILINSLVSEIDFVQINRIVVLVLVAVHLVIDGHSIPASLARIVITVERVGHAVQCDLFEEQVIS